jgi:transcriptional regulator with XRE-family HTH domain
MNKFGELLRSKREKKQLLLRHVAAELDIDTAMLSKIERGEKIAKHEFIEQLARILEINCDELFSLWLADQIFRLVDNKEQALNALRIVENEIKTRV